MSAPSPHARAHPGGLGPPELTEVAEDVYAYIQPDGSWYINNTGFVVGPDAVVAVDTCSTERRTRAFREAISTVTSAPVRTLVNTHHHGDHTYGNCVFDAATVIGHTNARTELLAAGPPANTGFFDPVDWGAVRLAPPTLTFDDRVTLWSGDLPMEVSYVGEAAHTSNDSIVWLPERGVLFCGDLLFNGGTPFLLMGSVTGAIRVLEQVLTPIPASVVVAGHGPTCGPELIATITGYLRFVLDTAEKGMAAGLSPLETARGTDLGEYAGWLDAERLVGNLHRAYHDLLVASGVGRTPVDIAAALTDMVAYNGGRPLSCYA